MLLLPAQEPTEWPTEESWLLFQLFFGVLNPPTTFINRYRSRKLCWDFKPHSPTLFSNSISPEEGTITIKAQQLTRSLVLTVRAPLDSFARVAGPTRAGFVPHSVESYSATATAGGRERLFRLDRVACSMFILLPAAEHVVSVVVDAAWIVLTPWCALPLCCLRRCLFHFCHRVLRGW